MFMHWSYWVSYLVTFEFQCLKTNLITYILTCCNNRLMSTNTKTFSTVMVIKINLKKKKTKSNLLIALWSISVWNARVSRFFPESSFCCNISIKFFLPPFYIHNEISIRRHSRVMHVFRLTKFLIYKVFELSTFLENNIMLKQFLKRTIVNMYYHYPTWTLLTRNVSVSFSR